MADTEPRVVTASVRAVLDRTIRTDDADQGEAVALIAERAGTSSRTVYRVLGLQTADITLDLADRLLVAVGGHISECELVMPDGSVQ